jgi:hypothetical protein
MRLSNVSMSIWRRSLNREPGVLNEYFFGHKECGGHDFAIVVDDKAKPVGPD